MSDWMAHQGKSHTSPPMTLGRDQLLAYSAGIAETAPRHTDPEHPEFSGAPLVVAASFIAGTGAILFDLNLGSKLMRIVHAGLDIELLRPLHEGDTLACTATFDGAEEKRSGELICMGFTLDDGAGETVCRGTTRYFLRAKRPPGDKPKEPAPETADSSPPDHVVTETVVEGQSLLYAEGSGDRFPIHTDPNFARSVGLPDVILHGMCTLGFATRAVIDSVAVGDSSRLRNLSVRFAKMVFHGDTLTTRIWTHETGATFITENQRGEKVLEAGKVTLP